MSGKQPANLPPALVTARREFDRWRRRHRKRARLPKELWRAAVALARKHGFSKTAQALGLRYDSLKKHLDQSAGTALTPTKSKPAFLELVPRRRTPGLVECTIEWLDDGDATVRMRIVGAALSELVAPATVLRSGQT